jgi:hypothetical protein
MALNSAGGDTNSMGMGWIPFAMLFFTVDVALLAALVTYFIHSVPTTPRPRWHYILLVCATLFYDEIVLLGAFETTDSSIDLDFFNFLLGAKIAVENFLFDLFPLLVPCT